MRPLALLALAIPLAAHKYHFSRAEIDYQPPRVEIVITLHAEDLPFDADSEKAACAYVLAHFELKGVKLRCAGAKATLHYVDVFAEAEVDKPPSSLRNRLLVTEFPDQRNAVLLRRAAKPVGKAIEFTAADEWKTLSWQP